jgi:anoctamin-10
MALLNNFLELRSDAFKITVHHRRPVPQRTDTIGPWLDALTFLTWLGALTNAALVYLFHPQTGYVAATAAIHARNAEAEMKIRMCEAAGAFSGDLGVCGAQEEVVRVTGETGEW